MLQSRRENKINTGEMQLSGEGLQRWVWKREGLTSVLNAGPQALLWLETGTPRDPLDGEEHYNITKQEEMNAVININKYTEENQLSSQAKSLNLRASNTSQFMCSAPTLSWIFITTEYDLAVELLIDLTGVYSTAYVDLWCHRSV